MNSSPQWATPLQQLCLSRGLGGSLTRRADSCRLRVRQTWADPCLLFTC